MASDLSFLSTCLLSLLLKVLLTVCVNIGGNVDMLVCFLLLFGVGVKCQIRIPVNNKKNTSGPLTGRERHKVSFPLPLCPNSDPSQISHWSIKGRSQELKT